MATKPATSPSETAKAETVKDEPSQAATQADLPPVGGQGAPRRVAVDEVSDTTSSRIDKSKLRLAIEEARKTVADAAARNPRRTRLELRKVDPWSAMKFSFAASFVLAITFVVAAALLYTILDAIGIFTSINETIASLTSGEGQEGEEVGFEINGKLIVGGSALVAALSIVFFTALATLGAFIYNVCSDLAGGIEVTLAERE